MKVRAAIDVSGLAWRYRTGVQNLYWAFVDAWARSPELHGLGDVVFYDRSGAFNATIAQRVGSAYLSSAPRWWPPLLRRPLQSAIRGLGLFNPLLGDTVNHVWNWGLHHPSDGPASITIPDVLPLEYPDFFDARFKRVTEKSLRFAAERAQHVFCISHYVKQRVSETAGIDLQRIRVVYPGIDAAYFETQSPQLADGLLIRHGLRAGQYLLSSGFLDPRKNLTRQLQAFGQVVARGSPLKYALTGLRTGLSDELMALIESPALRSRVVFLGYVSQPELLALTSRAAALMYCSLAEGFGLPIIEAMATGAPVITSRSSSMQELAEGRACLVNPLDVDDIARAIETTLGTSPKQRLATIEANRLHAQQFTIERWMRGHLQAWAGPAASTGASGALG